MIDAGLRSMRISKSRRMALQQHLGEQARLEFNTAWKPGREGPQGLENHSLKLLMQNMGIEGVDGLNLE